MFKTVRYRRFHEGVKLFRCAVVEIDPERMDEPLRCPKCGAGIDEHDIVAAVRQLGLPGPDSYDEITMLIVCGDCRSQTGYIARIFTSK